MSYEKRARSESDERERGDVGDPCNGMFGI